MNVPEKKESMKESKEQNQPTNELTPSPMEVFSKGVRFCKWYVLIITIYSAYIVFYWKLFFAVHYIHSGSADISLSLKQIVRNLTHPLKRPSCSSEIWKLAKWIDRSLIDLIGWNKYFWHFGKCYRIYIMCIVSYLVLILNLSFLSF